MSITYLPPRVYAEWVTLLDLLRDKTNDDAVLQAMRQGTLEWQTGVAERFVKKLTDTVNSRLNGATDKFQKELSRSRGEERAIIQALLSLRRELAFLANAMNLPVLPEKDRATYRGLVMEQADKIQKSLEDSAKNDRSGKLASIVRNHRVNGF